MKLCEIIETKLKATKDGEAFLMRFPFLYAGVKNANAREYPAETIKKAIAKLKDRLTRRSAYGAAGHPKEMEVDDVSHQIVDVDVDEKGNAMATVKVLPTIKGRNLGIIIKNGGSLGVSSRGSGDVKDGVVQDNLEIAGVDFVLSPSFNIHVGKEAMFESAPLTEDGTDPAVLAAKGFKSLDELNEAMKAGGVTEVDVEKILRLKFISAQQAGFTGSAEDFRKTFNRTAEDSRAEAGFADAQKNAGYKGTLAQYRAAHLVK